MFVVSVMPIARGAFKDRLSFFSKKALEPGMIVDITVRNQKAVGLVLSSTDAREEKSSLRAKEFALKKLEPKNPRRIFLPATIEALQSVAAYHAVPDGVVLAHFTPTAIFSESADVARAANTAPASALAADRVALQAEYEERIATYRNTTRETFAKGESVVVVAPTIPEADRLYNELSRGIEAQTLLLTSQLTKKQAVTAWNRATEDPEPLLIIMTHSFLTLPRENVTTLFIERESARGYLAREAPHLDTRIAVEAIAGKRGARIVYADFPLRVETHARLKAHDMEEFGRLQRTVRSGFSGQKDRARIIDSRTKEDLTAPTDGALKKRKFSPLTEPVAGLIRTETERGSRLFVYAARRGVAPLTVCNDCGTPVTDPSTGAPMTLHKTKNGNVFLSFRSGAILPGNTACRTCGGWNLVSLGIGVERVADEVRKLVPKTPLFMLTTESATTHAQAKKIAKQFFATPGAIMIGTDRALPYLYEPVEYSVIASLDSLLSSSIWRAHTNALHTLFYLQGRTTETVYVQTRLPDAAPVRAFASGNPTDFIDQELEDRKMYGYPPFATFIGLTWSGTENAVQKTAVAVAETLKGWEIVGPLPPRAVSKNRFLGRAVIRLEPGSWPDERLSNALKSLAPQVAVTVDPDEIV